MQKKAKKVIKINSEKELNLEFQQFFQILIDTSFIK